MTAVALAWAAPILILGGVAAIAWSILGGHRIRCLPRVIAYRAARAVLRVRWAWACRKPPARTEGKLNRADYLTFAGLVETWRQSGADERSRT